MGLLRAVARLLLPGAVRVYKSVRKITSFLDTQALSYEADIRFQDVREAIAHDEYVDKVRGVPLREKVPSRLWIDTKFKKPYRFRYVAKVSYLDPGAKRAETKFMSFYTNKELDGFDLQKELDGYVSGFEDYKGRQIMSIAREDVFHDTRFDEAFTGAVDEAEFEEWLEQL